MAVLDDGAFASFYETHRRDLYLAVLATVGDRRLATEAVDEAFVRSAERWREVSTMTNAPGWVYRVAVNWATSWRRKIRLRPTLPATALDQPHHDNHETSAILAVLAGIPKDRRQLLVLRYVLGYSVDEVANIVGLSPSAVKSRVHRAIAELRSSQEVVDADR